MSSEGSVIEENEEEGSGVEACWIVDGEIGGSGKKSPYSRRRSAWPSIEWWTMTIFRLLWACRTEMRSSDLIGVKISSEALLVSGTSSGEVSGSDGDLAGNLIYDVIEMKCQAE